MEFALVILLKLYSFKMKVGYFLPPLLSFPAVAGIQETTGFPPQQGMTNWGNQKTHTSNLIEYSQRGSN